jgi:ppGpp synthetase/RelA/SpoT-type nucleotidyltranferase
MDAPARLTCPFSSRGVQTHLYSRPMSESPEWEHEYRANVQRYERLKDEALFSLGSEADKQGIKLHSLTGRVKEFESLREKVRRKSYASPLAQAPDLVGVRAVALFLSDLPKLDAIVLSVFDIVASDDKIDGVSDPSTFGYMSRHYEACIKSDYAGPRYDDLHGVRFEIQVRTLLMDAWANVSHYLAYKGDSSIPEELRRDFHALSGLFYVADKHFELFFDRAIAVQHEVDQTLQASNLGVPVSLDSLAAYLERRYPERKRSDRADYAELAEELLMFGFESLRDVEQMLDRTAAEFASQEERNPGYYTGCGVVRISLGSVNPEYEHYLQSLMEEEEATQLEHDDGIP